MNKTKTKISREHGRQMVKEGFITEKGFDEMVEKGMIAGDKSKPRLYSFAGTDATIYFPAAIIKPSRKAGANNTRTEELEMFAERWETETRPIFDNLVAELAESV